MAQKASMVKGAKKKCLIENQCVWERDTEKKEATTRGEQSKLKQTFSTN